MPTPPHTVEPTAESVPGASIVPTASDRIRGYDFARSLALLGMFVVHFGLVVSADQTRPAWAVWVLKFFDGRAAATFVTLAGIGVTLMSRRAVESRDAAAIARVRKTLVRRGLFLLVIGHANLVIWPGDILRVYGVSLILAAGCITAPGRRLLRFASGFVLGFVALFLALDYGKHWDWATMSYRRLWTLDGVVRNLLFDGFRSVFPWTGLFLFGMWLGRLDLRDRATNTRLLVAAAGAVLFAEAASRLLIAYFLAHPHGLDVETIHALFWTESMPPLPIFLIDAVGASVLVIALSVRAAEIRPLSPFLSPFAAAGRMALTWYFAHILLGLGAVVALDLVSSQSLPVAEGCGVLVFALAVLLSSLWRLRFTHGPLEWVMRRIAG